MTAGARGETGTLYALYGTGNTSVGSIHESSWSAANAGTQIVGQANRTVVKAWSAAFQVVIIDVAIYASPRITFSNAVDKASGTILTTSGTDSRSAPNHCKAYEATCWKSWVVLKTGTGLNSCTLYAASTYQRKSVEATRTDIRVLRRASRTLCRAFHYFSSENYIAIKSNHARQNIIIKFAAGAADWASKDRV